MTAHERLRQLHANATPGPWEADGYPDESFLRIGDEWGADWGPGHDDDVRVIATLRNALPQLANLAEAAAEAVAKYAPADEDWTAWNNQDGNGWKPLRAAAQALADLEQALNPTRNTQSPT